MWGHIGHRYNGIIFNINSRKIQLLAHSANIADSLFLFFVDPQFCGHVFELKSMIELIRNDKETPIIWFHLMIILHWLGRLRRLRRVHDRN